MVKLRLVNDDDQLMVITDGGQIIRTRVSEIRTAGRNTQGVIVIRLKGGERVVDVEPVAEHEEDAEEGAEAGPDDPAVASPAVASPAVASPAVASPAVASPAVASVTSVDGADPGEADPEGGQADPEGGQEE
jgi:hypothetical protein